MEIVMTIKVFWKCVSETKMDRQGLRGQIRAIPA